MNQTWRILSILFSTGIALILATVFFQSTNTSHAQVNDRDFETIARPDQEGEEEEEEEPVNICAAEGQENFLTNPSFEGKYTSYIPPNGHPDCSAGVCTTVQIPEEGDWEPWWRSHDDNDPHWIINNPEYKPACVGAESCPFPNRLRDGKEALQYFTFESTHEAGMYQQVSVQAESTVCFSAWGHSWYTVEDDPDVSVNNGAAMWQKIGIDPTGGTDWQSDSIIWSDQDTHPNGRTQLDKYGLFTITAQAEAPTITVFLYSQPQWAFKHNDVYWDDTFLSELESVPVSPTLALSGPTETEITLLATITDPVSISNAYQLTAVDAATISWQVSTASPDGLPISTTLETISNTTTLTVSVDTSTLSAGSYGGIVSIRTTPAATNQPIEIPVSVTVAEQIYLLYTSLVSER